MFPWEMAGIMIGSKRKCPIGYEPEVQLKGENVVVDKFGQLPVPWAPVYHLRQRKIQQNREAVLWYMKRVPVEETEEYAEEDGGLRVWYGGLLAGNLSCREGLE